MARLVSRRNGRSRPFAAPPAGHTTSSAVLLHHLDTLPRGFIETPAHELHRILPGPSLVHLPGERPEALFVTVLQHGNEATGLNAVQRLLADYRGRPLPRALSLFVPNVAAARTGHRQLEHQPDFNRCWPGTELTESPETRMMAEVVEAMRGRPLLASVDIHNTTGENPHFACVNRLDDRCLQLARMFARTVVYFTRPRGAQSQAFLELCPAVILECGRVGNSFGVEHARDYLERCLRLEAVPARAPAPAGIDLFRSVALVQVPDATRFRFGDGGDDGVDLALDPDLDRMNFRELPPGTALGRVRGTRPPVRALDPGGREVTDAFFDLAGGRLRLRRAVMPSLLTRDPRIVRQDCLCHLMERVVPESSGQAA